MWRATLGGVLMASALMAGVTGSSAKPPASYPVSITVKSKAAAACPESCITFYGALRSTKAPCSRRRVLEATVRLSSEGRTETFTEPFGMTDAKGRFDTLKATIEGQRILWVVVRVPKARIGGVKCQAAASAKVRPDRAS